MTKNNSQLSIKNLTTTFKVGNKEVTAVNNISFEIPAKKMIGLVGEWIRKKCNLFINFKSLPDNGKISLVQLFGMEKTF